MQIREGFDPPVTSIEGILRGSLLKLQYADACMKPLPKGSSPSSMCMLKLLLESS